MERVPIGTGDKTPIMFIAFPFEFANPLPKRGDFLAQFFAIVFSHFASLLQLGRLAMPDLYE